MFPYVLFDLDGTLTDRNRVLPNVCGMPFAVWESKSRIWTSLSLLSGRPLRTVSVSFMGWIRNRRLKRWQKYRERFSEKGLYEMRFIGINR